MYDNIRANTHVGHVYCESKGYYVRRNVQNYNAPTWLVCYLVRSHSGKTYLLKKRSQITVWGIRDQGATGAFARPTSPKSLLLLYSYSNNTHLIGRFKMSFVDAFNIAVSTLILYDGWDLAWIIFEYVVK